MVLTKKHNKILIGFIAIALAVVCVLLPFLSVKNKVFADVTYQYNSPTFTPTLIYKQNATSFYSDSLHQITFTPSLTTTDSTLFISFGTLYDAFNNSSGITSRTMNIYQYNSTTQITSGISSTYTWSPTSVPNEESSAIADIRFGVTNTAYNGIHCTITATRLPVTEDIGGSSVITYYDYFDASLMSYIYESARVYTGSISNQTRYYKLSYTDRHNVSINFTFELSDNTALYNLYNSSNFVQRYLYVGQSSLYTSDAQIQDSYDNGYNVGYNLGSGDGYSTGYDTGYSAGSTSGYNQGYSVGFTAGQEDANTYTFLNVIGAVIDAPIQGITGLLNFELFGVNLSAFFYGIITVAIVIAVIRFIKGGK